MNREETLIRRSPRSVQVVFGASQTWAFLDRSTDVQMMGANLPVLGQTISLTFATGTLPGLKKRLALTAGGAAFMVREVHLVDDGGLTRAWLEEA